MKTNGGGNRGRRAEDERKAEIKGGGKWGQKKGMEKPTGKENR